MEAVPCGLEVLREAGRPTTLGPGVVVDFPPYQGDMPLNRLVAGTKTVALSPAPELFSSLLEPAEVSGGLPREGIPRGEYLLFSTAFSRLVIRIEVGL